MAIGAYTSSVLTVKLGLPLIPAMLTGGVVAAVFGLTPGLLFTRLQQQAENYAADLKTSEATQAPSP